MGSSSSDSDPSCWFTAHCTASDVQPLTGGVLGQDEAEREHLLAIEAVGDQASVPHAPVELVEDGLGVTAVGVDELVGEGSFGDLLEVSAR